jgi:CHAT domain-containing protein
MLTAEEVAELDLGAQELIVLSACESGLGHLSAGQGIIGLFGALDRAGTRAVVSALWKVEDRATTLLMESFYRRLWAAGAPIGPAQALRAAQREMIRGNRTAPTGEPFSRPQFWAAFVVGGDPFPASPPNPR